MPRAKSTDVEENDEGVNSKNYFQKKLILQKFIETLFLQPAVVHL